MIRTRAAVTLFVLAVAAGVISLALAVTLIFVRVRAGAAALELPTVTVEAVYPGATASVAEEKLAGPIEQQINGVEHMRWLRSRCGSDGLYRLEVSFDPGTDIDLALTLVQNRVGVALPALPAEVQRIGLTVRKPSPGLLMLICISSRDNSIGTVDLNNYANIYLKNELARVAGVSEVTVVGAEDLGVRIRLDPDKLAACKLTIEDVTKAVDSQDLGAKDGPPAGPGGTSHLQPNQRDGQSPLEQLESIVIKADPDGRVFHLRDVTTSRVDYGSRLPGYVSLDGEVVAVLAVYPFGPSQPREVSTRVRAKLADLREQFPPGVDASTAFDFSQPATAEAPGFLLIDVNPREGETAESIVKLLVRAGQSLSGVAGVRNVLGLQVQPFDRERNQPCLVACLGPAKGAAVDRKRLVDEIRALFPRGDKEPGIRIRDLSEAAVSLRSCYPIHFAIVGPDRGSAQALAGELATRLSQDRRLTDVWSGPRLVSVPSVDIDRAKAAAMGVSPAEISAWIGPVFGPARAGNITIFGRTWPVWVEVDRGRSIDIDTLKLLKVRNDKGGMVPFRAIATLRQDRVPDRLERVDLFPAVSVTASLAGGLSLAEARFVCEGAAHEVLANGRASGYRLVWLREMPAGRAPARR